MGVAEADRVLVALRGYFSSDGHIFWLGLSKACKPINKAHLSAPESNLSLC
jgi:hypothetical protein